LQLLTYDLTFSTAGNAGTLQPMNAGVAGDFLLTQPAALWSIGANGVLTYLGAPAITVVVDAIATLEKNDVTAQLSFVISHNDDLNGNAIFTEVANGEQVILNSPDGLTFHQMSCGSLTLARTTRSAGSSARMATIRSLSREARCTSGRRSHEMKQWRTDPAAGLVEVDGEIPTLSGAPANVFDTQVRRWTELACEASHDFAVPVHWILGTIYGESAGFPNARSPVGAIGLMQLHSAAARQGLSDDELRDPRTNIRLGARLINRIWSDGDQLPEVASKYNAGSETSGRPHASSSSPWGIREESGYIGRVVAAANYAADTFSGTCEQKPVPVKLERAPDVPRPRPTPRDSEAVLAAGARGALGAVALGGQSHSGHGRRRASAGRGRPWRSILRTAAPAILRPTFLFGASTSRSRARARISGVIVTPRARAASLRCGKSRYRDDGTQIFRDVRRTGSSGSRPASPVRLFEVRPQIPPPGKSLVAQVVAPVRPGAMPAKPPGSRFVLYAAGGIAVAVFLATLQPVRPTR
jgi:hypothetical protein